MDPVTVVSLVASVAEIAFGVFINLNKFYRKVRDAPRQSKELREELDSLVDILADLQEALDKGLHTKGQEALRKELEKMDCSLNDLHRRTIPKSTNYFIRRMQWPLLQEETARIIKKIEYFKGKLNAILNMRQLYRS